MFPGPVNPKEDLHDHYPERFALSPVEEAEADDENASVFSCGNYRPTDEDVSSAPVPFCPYFSHVALPRLLSHRIMCSCIQAFPDRTDVYEYDANMPGFDDRFVSAQPPLPHPHIPAGTPISKTPSMHAPSPSKSASQLL